MALTIEEQHETNDLDHDILATREVTFICGTSASTRTSAPARKAGWNAANGAPTASTSATRHTSKSCLPKSTHQNSSRCGSKKPLLLRPAGKELLRSRPSSRLEVLNAIDHALPGALSAKQKGERVSYLLQSLRKQGKIYSEGATSAAKWHLQE